jgi:hypothetical protein
MRVEFKKILERRWGRGKEKGSQTHKKQTSELTHQKSWVQVLTLPLTNWYGQVTVPLYNSFWTLFKRLQWNTILEH